MVIGIESFKEKFKDYTNCYTVIGGTACDILMTEADQNFRATKDVDIILILEDRYQDFASLFWQYIKEGGYMCGWKNNPDMHFYRFTDPKPGYPVQIELFSRMPGYNLEAAEGIVPIHIDENTSSLSAILLNDEYYNFMLEGRAVVTGISVLKSEYLIPFKMFAWIDLNRRKLSGEHVDEKNIKKHKNDVFRLLQIVEDGIHIEITEMIRDDIMTFIDSMKEDQIDLFQLGLPYNKEQALEMLRTVYLPYDMLEETT